MKYRGRRQYGRGSATVGFNATSLIDLIFLLTIFFVLVSGFASAEMVKMFLPEPVASQAKPVRIPERVIINCQLAEPGRPAAGALYSVGANAAEPLPQLLQRLEAIKSAAAAAPEVIIRADRDLRYDDVRAVMAVVAGAGLTTVNVAATVEEGPPR